MEQRIIFSISCYQPIKNILRYDVNQSDVSSFRNTVSSDACYCTHKVPVTMFQGIIL